MAALPFPAIKSQPVSSIKTLILLRSLSRAHFRHSFCSYSSIFMLYSRFDTRANDDALPPAADESMDATATYTSAAPADQDNQKPLEGRPLRGERRGRGPEDPAALICYMMAQRPWTTRLQNSIRDACPCFDRPLVLGVLRAARTPDHALRFFRWVEKTGFRHDRETYLEVIRLLSQASMLNHARCILLDDMPKRGVPFEEEMFLPLIEAYGREGIPQESVKLFGRMPTLGVERTVRSYDVFFKAILRRGRGMMAKRAFNAMLRNGLEPTLYTYNILIWGFCLSEMMQTATRFFGEMKERGVAPDVVTYNTLISGCVRGKKMEDAQKLFDEMGSVGLAPNAITYTTMIKGYIGDGKPDEGLRLFHQMASDGVHPSEKTYSVLLPALCDDSEKAPEACKLLDVMAEKHLRPNDISVFIKLISSLCDSGRLDEALGVLRLIDRFRLSADSSHYGVMIESFCKAGMFDRAVTMLDEVLQRGTLSYPSSPPFEPAAYGPAIKFMTENGLTSKAETLFRELMKKGVDDSAAFNHIVYGHAKEGTPESANVLLAIMSRRGIQTDAEAEASLVESFLSKGEPADAKVALDGMMERGHMPSSALFRSVMEALFSDGRVQTASRVMKSMVEKGVTDHMDMIQKILEALLLRGHVEEALGRINLLAENALQPDLDELLATLCDKGKTIAALKLADEALQRDWDVTMKSHDRVLDALCNAGKTLNAYSLLCMVEKKGGHTDKKAAAALVKSLIDEGNTKQADVLSRLVFPKERKGFGATVAV